VVQCLLGNRSTFLGKLEENVALKENVHPAVYPGGVMWINLCVATHGALFPLPITL
jgi:hypothetical protein